MFLRYCKLMAWGIYLTYRLVLSSLSQSIFKINLKIRSSDFWLYILVDLEGLVTQTLFPCGRYQQVLKNGSSLKVGLSTSAHSIFPPPLMVSTFVRCVCVCHDRHWAFHHQEMQFCCFNTLLLQLVWYTNFTEMRNTIPGV